MLPPSHFSAFSLVERCPLSTVDDNNTDCDVSILPRSGLCDYFPYGNLKAETTPGVSSTADG